MTRCRLAAATTRSTSAAGNNTVDGGTGNDLIFTGALGNDSIVGGADFDTVYYDNSTGPVTVNLGNGAGSTTGAGNDTLVGIEGVRGSPGNDNLIGDDFDNEIQGGAGADSLVGGGGIDLVRFTIEVGGVTVNLATQRATTPTGTDTLVGFENVRGSNDYADSITGDGNANWLRGGSGGAANDTLVGGAGNDTLDGEGGQRQHGGRRRQRHLPGGWRRRCGGRTAERGHRRGPRPVGQQHDLHADWQRREGPHRKQRCRRGHADRQHAQQHARRRPGQRQHLGRRRQ
jgi:hypothetical protein